MADVEVDVTAARAPKKRTFKKFKGVDLDTLLDMSTNDLVKLFGARSRAPASFLIRNYAKHSQRKRVLTDNSSGSKELVTFGSHPLSNLPEISNVGRHLSAAEFHYVLQNGGQLVKENNPKKLILLDARNLYETRIGKYTPTVETLDPEIRQYSDLPSWIDNNSEKLKGNCVLMYCTGGIRCEMASAYGSACYTPKLRTTDNIRVSVGSSDTNVLGSCFLCKSAYDDYTSRSRCSYCRMLVLVCDICREKVYEYVCNVHHAVKGE
ncbi:hypothetical protein POM88_044960 [Heracleum sosnowskyi]|uniref:Rhodanese domain-containing protein n=1 Tax=Heracleum sosnowskyi TaxID=360622 RepID=A0AAD8H527_9APIA|nr:hypothetical protein POM88_044960 [Heracleum sosnowskyi]